MKRKHQTQHSQGTRRVREAISTLTLFLPIVMPRPGLCSNHNGLVRRPRIAQKSISAVGVWNFMGAMLVPPLGGPYGHYGPTPGGP